MLYYNQEREEIKMYDRVYVIREYNPKRKRWEFFGQCSTADEAISIKENAMENYFATFAIFEEIYNASGELIFKEKLSY